MIDHESATPLYLQLADELEAQIKAGNPPPDRILPGELALSQTYGVARGTARRAVAVLRERGLVVTIPGRGTFTVKK